MAKSHSTSSEAWQELEQSCSTTCCTFQQTLQAAGQGGGESTGRGRKGEVRGRTGRESAGGAQSKGGLAVGRPDGRRPPSPAVGDREDSSGRRRGCGGG